VNQQALIEKWQQMEQRRCLFNWRKDHDRLRVVVTLINEPEPNDPATYFYIQVKATDRLRAAAVEFSRRYPLHGSFADAPPNVCPGYGPQLVIDELAFYEATGYWGPDDWRDAVKREWIKWAVDDLIFSLTEHHTLVEFASDHCWPGEDWSA